MIFYEYDSNVKLKNRIINSLSVIKKMHARGQ